MSAPLLFLGGGKMGGAIARGLIADGHAPDQITVADPGLSDLPDLPGANLLGDAKEWTGSKPAAVILAIKPQLMSAILPDLAPLFQDTLIISIAAGRSLAFFKTIFGDQARLVRAMPNLPAAIGAGMTGWVGTPALSDADRTLTQTILAATGTAHQVENEDQIDAWTGVAGSGPAYVFHLMETLAAAAEDLGFNTELSQSLALETVLGAAKLAKADNLSFATLRENVTSPGGTTAAGLEVLMADLPELTLRTAYAAYDRAKELA